MAAGGHILENSPARPDIPPPSAALRCSIEQNPDLCVYQDAILPQVEVLLIIAALILFIAGLISASE